MCVAMTPRHGESRATMMSKATPITVQHLYCISPNYDLPYIHCCNYIRLGRNGKGQSNMMILSNFQPFALSINRILVQLPSYSMLVHDFCAHGTTFLRALP